MCTTESVNHYLNLGLHFSSCSQHCLGNCRFYCTARTKVIPHYTGRKEEEVQTVRYMAVRKWNKHSERKHSFLCVCAPSGILLRDRPGGKGILEQPACKTANKRESLRRIPHKTWLFTDTIRYPLLKQRDQLQHTVFDV